MNKLRIVLADDHGVLRDGLTLLINAQPDMEVVACARGGREAVQLAEQWSPHVLVLDISMPDLGGAEATEQIRQRCPHVRILALTRYADQGYLRRLLNAGASGYVLKRTAGEALIDAIRVVAEGGSYVDPTLAGGLVARMTTAASAQRDAPVHAGELSERETQVLRLIAWGQSNKEIAAQLGISVKTVESYKATALEKLQLRSRTDILRYALACNWLNEDGGPE
ncbi:response regulator [Variovorax sp. HW608]|uniref:response regulator n=1 Tax=Variovorax sp. HW608 TaxID=1034889 RepID=UPI000B5B02A1|nr:response regulator transcription factor [Variovorax sp. HW608]